MPADLDDGDRVDVTDALLQGLVRERGRKHGEHVVARRERRAEGGGARHERRHTGNDFHRMVLRHAPEHVHEGTVEEGVPFAQHRHVAPGVEVAADLDGGAIVDILGGKAGRHHGHPDADFFVMSIQMLGHDAAHQAFAVLRGRVGEHTGAPENPERLEGDQLRIARTDAQTVQRALHRSSPAAGSVATS